MEGHKGKPTTYKGIAFRSRLEARWAAFFDVVKWAWEYEPEVDGAYIPDFLLRGTQGREIYVEVKPLALFMPKRDEIIAKARSAIGGAPLLILTDQFPGACGFPDSPIIGYLDECEPDEDWSLDNVVLFQPGGYDFAGEFGSWAGRLSGRYDGNAMFEGTMVQKAEFFHLWSRAGNAIQWKPAR